MDKNEILEKSRRENRDQDEREKTVRIQGESFSLIFVFAVGLPASRVRAAKSPSARRWCWAASW